MPNGLNILISPSGKLYGSEQVLTDYLQHTKLHWSVYVCGRDLLYQKLSQPGFRHRLRSFNNVKVLYLRIFSLCLFGRVRCVYVNEGGHARYLFLLSKIFRKVRFMIHVRLVEDAAEQRWKDAREVPNLTVVAISGYISRLLSHPNELVHDPFPFSNDVPGDSVQRSPGVFTIGVIGRISLTKGLNIIMQILALVKQRNLTDHIKFRFYGEPSTEVAGAEMFDRLQSYSNVKVMGFERDRSKIYQSVDCVLHAAETEPLGRIFLEAVNYGRPLVGINAGGIGEIGELLALQKLLVENDAGVADALLDKITYVRDNFEELTAEVLSRKPKAASIFDPAKYAASIDRLAQRRIVKREK